MSGGAARGDVVEEAPGERPYTAEVCQSELVASGKFNTPSPIVDDCDDNLAKMPTDVCLTECGPASDLICREHTP